LAAPVTAEEVSTTLRTRASAAARKAASAPFTAASMISCTRPSSK
jgi:hypothetical protein